MEIKYIAHSSFVIKSKTATVVTDPYANLGIKYPKTEADIVTVSHQHDDHNNVSGVDGTPLICDWPGEFEAKEVAIRGFNTFHDAENGVKRGKNIMYKIVTESISILHCGDLGHDLTDEQIDAIGAIDILCIPIGGIYTIDPQMAVHIVKKIEPALVIPMHYANPRLDKKVFGELRSVSDFLALMGQTGVIALPKLVVKREDIATESNAKVVVLEETA